MNELDLLRTIDPAADARADEHAAERLLHTVIAEPRPARRRRVPRRLLVAVPAAAAMLIALPFALHRSGESLAAKAYAATSPGDEIVHEMSVWTTQTWQGTTQTFTDESWYRPSDGSARRVQSVPGGQPSQVVVGPGDSRPWTDLVRSVTLGFRLDFANARLEDEGTTTFEGRSVHAYRDGTVTYYVDPATALPAGERFTSHMPGQEDRQDVTTIVVKTYEKLPPTPENLAKVTG
jgi:hypothetical protein